MSACIVDVATLKVSARCLSVSQLLLSVLTFLFVNICSHMYVLPESEK